MSAGNIVTPAGGVEVTLREGEFVSPAASFPRPTEPMAVAS